MLHSGAEERTPSLVHGEMGELKAQFSNTRWFARLKRGSYIRVSEAVP